MDELTYHYKPNLNQLDHVSDKVDQDGITTNADDIKTQDVNNYRYNSIGQLVSNTEEGIYYMYNASSLVTEVQKDNQPVVKFYYNDKGHRVRKESFTNGTLTSTDHYVRDAAGSTLAIYNNSTLKEMPIYGASRLGVYYTPPSGEPEGEYVYQLTDHLGNVRAVIAKVSNSAAISSSTDYYPFGMPMLGRQTVGGETYRYAFQGQEKDPETGKEAFQLRLWDSRIGRWLTTDPYGQFFSPYLGMGNNPVSMTDPDGGYCPGCPTEGYSEGDYYTASDGQTYQHTGIDGWASSPDANVNISSASGFNWNYRFNLKDPFPDTKLDWFDDRVSGPTFWGKNKKWGDLGNKKGKNSVISGSYQGTDFQFGVGGGIRLSNNKVFLKILQGGVRFEKKLDKLHNNLYPPTAETIKLDTTTYLLIKKYSINSKHVHSIQYDVIGKKGVDSVMNSFIGKTFINGTSAMGADTIRKYK